MNASALLNILNQPTRRSLTLNMVIALGSALVMNGLIFSLGWSSADNITPPSFAPPAFVIGLVWTILFPLMASARWRLNFYSESTANQAQIWVTFLIVSCLVYPLYSLALSSVLGGFLGNIWTIALASFTVSRVWSTSKPAAYSILPVIIWVSFATSITMSELGWLS
jgi:tryptophan-rich sensory protein